MKSAAQLKAIAVDEIDNKAVQLEELSTRIWSNPELAMQEKYAHKIVSEFLENDGFSVEKHTPLETSFIARSITSDGPRIGLFCEYDALPGIGHACGHNLIAEAGVAAGVGVKAALSADPSLKGRVLVFGTPAEEAIGGKLLMAEKGSFEECDVCMIVHPLLCDVELEDDHIISITELEISFTGKAAHASASPWEGINAVDAAVSCYVSISMLRQQMKPNCRIHGVFKDGGDRPNIIPKHASLLYYVRAPTDIERDALTEKVKSCAQGAAEATGCTVEFPPTSGSYSNMRSNLTLRKLYASNLETTGYKPTYIPGLSLLGSTDVGNVSYIKPTIHPYYRIPTTEDCHTATFQIAAGKPAAQLPTLQVAKAMAMTAIDIICNPAILTEIKEEFENRHKQP